MVTKSLRKRVDTNPGGVEEMIGGLISYLLLLDYTNAYIGKQVGILLRALEEN